MSNLILPPTKQNDPALATAPSLAPYGCLYATLHAVVARHHGEALPPDDLLDAYEWLVAEGHIIDVPGRQAFVIDHTATGRAFQWYLNRPQTFRYIAREDYGGPGPDKSFGNLDDAEYFIAYGRAEGWRIGHFFEATRDAQRLWDPYWPSKPIIEVLSLRGYVA